MSRREESLWFLRRARKLLAAWPNATVLVLCAAEAAYVLGRMHIQAATPNAPVSRELGIDAWRCVFIFLYAAVIDWQTVMASASRTPDFLGLLLPLVMVECLAVGSTSSGWSDPNPGLYAVTAIFPAVKEELLFRGILQQYLVKRVGVFSGILVASAFFAACHVGTEPEHPVRYLSLFASGVLLGAVYARTGNLLLVIALHTLIDVWAALVPGIARLPTWESLFTVTAIELILIAFWFALAGLKKADR